MYIHNPSMDLKKRERERESHRVNFKLRLLSGQIIDFNSKICNSQSKERSNINHV